MKYNSMMAAYTNKFPAWFITFGLLSLHVSVVFSSSSPQTAEADRSPCVDGTYKHDGRDCCLCGAGMQVVKHCNTSLNDGICDSCVPGTYSSHPNDRESCEPCTSCLHPNDNLEEDEPCISARDAKCRCKKDHYCVSGTEICRLCHPCKACGAEGIKVACTGNNNTVCNDKIEGGNQVGTIFGIIVPIVFIALVGVAVFICKKRPFRKRQQTPVANGNAADVEMQPIRVSDVDPQIYLPDIAEAIGWKDMQEVAIRTGIPNATIDSCKLNHPGDSQEQTLQLLRTWVESQGSKASNNLIQILQNCGKKRKAEKVAEILSSGS